METQFYGSSCLLMKHCFASYIFTTSSSGMTRAHIIQNQFQSVINDHLCFEQPKAHLVVTFSTITNLTNVSCPNETTKHCLRYVTSRTYSKLHQRINVSKNIMHECQKSKQSNHLNSYLGFINSNFIFIIMIW